MNFDETTDFVDGMRCGIPLCCVLRFCLHQGDERQALQRGTAENRYGRFVPCHLLHRASDG